MPGAIVNHMVKDRTSSAAVAVKRPHMSGSVLGAARRRAPLLGLQAKLGEEKRERRRLWPKRDATAWTTSGLTKHIVGTCVRSDLRSLK